MGRKKAKQFNIVPMGTLGILILAKEKGLITNVSEYFEKLVDTGFRINEKYLHLLLQKAGELP
ncbi:DUF3368 domain-containing protein [Priestia megaterium]|nr:DUF3368 domain-containing protein [Priestia megaterium]